MMKLRTNLRKGMINIRKEKGKIKIKIKIKIKTKIIIKIIFNLIIKIKIRNLFLLNQEILILKEKGK
jgi:hypothetical protein